MLLELTTSLRQELEQAADHPSKEHLAGPPEHLATYLVGSLLAFTLAKKPTREDTWSQFKRFHARLPEGSSLFVEFCRLRELTPGITRVFAEVLDSVVDLAQSARFSIRDDLDGFVEDLLGTLTPDSRRSRGMFFTPRPVACFIVDALHALIADHFPRHAATGSNVVLFDFAAGLGTFLRAAAARGRGETLVGYEKTLASTELARFLLYLAREAPSAGKTRTASFQILQRDTLAQDFAPEDIRALDESQDRLLAIIGNPPYNARSRNAGEYIEGLMRAYKENLDEKNQRALADDYVKFLRYAQANIHAAGEGLLGVVTNNNFLDSITLYTMRASLLADFDVLYFLDLGGNRAKNPADENVFDIKEVGVAISLLVKLPRALDTPEVYYYSVPGEITSTRAGKLAFLEQARLPSIPWIALAPTPPDYWFVPKGVAPAVAAEYHEYWSLLEVFRKKTSGVETGRDHFFVEFRTPEGRRALARRVQEVVEAPVDEFPRLLEHHRLRSSSSWDVQQLRQVKSRNAPSRRRKYRPAAIVPYHYRPFDFRYLYYDRGIMSRDRFALARHFLQGDEGPPNLALVCVRQFVEDAVFNHVLVSRVLVDARLTLSNRGKASFFPLYLADSEPNLTPAFVKWLQEHYGSGISPREVLGYIYAVLHAPAYRHRYNALLQTDFPRVPFARERVAFRDLARLGLNLVNLHLLTEGEEPGGKEKGRELPGLQIHGNGNGTIVDRKLRHDPERARIYVNEEQWLAPVPTPAWTKEVCGYRVLRHWLRERHGRVLTPVALRAISRLVHVLLKTDELTATIDKAFCACFP